MVSSGVGTSVDVPKYIIPSSSSQSKQGMTRPAGVMASSSPGQEMIPPPGLARILAGSGSRTASRSSHMLSSRSKSVGRSSAATQAAVAAAAAGEEGEPSSPKVTCIGQVRMRNKTSTKPTTPRPKETTPGQCFHKALLYRFFPVRKKKSKCRGAGGVAGGRRSLWRGWAPLGGRWGRKGGYQRREPDSPGAPQLEFVVTKGVEEEEQQQERRRVSATATPPKNALLLTRCRSAPHHQASSLATTAPFVVCPLLAPGPPAGGNRSEKGAGELRRRRKKKNGERRSELAEATTELTEEEEEEEEEGTASESLRPLVLTRSRSEPGRRRRAA